MTSHSCFASLTKVDGVEQLAVLEPRQFRSSGHRCCGGPCEPADMMSPELALLTMEEYTVMCTTLGHNKAFSVKIDSNELVSELKNKIRAMEFQNLESALALKLYKVDILCLSPTHQPISH